MKDLAKERLGRKIFGNVWMLALAVCLVFSAIETAGNTILPGISAIILTGPMTYGLCYLFLKQAREGGMIKFGDLFSGFSSDFGQNLLIGLLTAVFTFLWSLLFIIPGIVKSYAYSMAYYIKADHPSYGWKECIDGSIELMRGHKWELFVLDLSFIGWYIVGALCLGIGTLWVVPYHMQARAVFYDSISGKALPAQSTYTENADDDAWYQE